MDCFMVDVTNIKDATMHDKVTLIGEDGNEKITVDLEKYSTKTDTISESVNEPVNEPVKIEKRKEIAEDFKKIKNIDGTQYISDKKIEEILHLNKSNDGNNDDFIKSEIKNEPVNKTSKTKKQEDIDDFWLN